MPDHNNTIKFDDLDGAIREALAGTDLPGNPLIYGFIAPDGYDHDQAFKLAELIVNKVEGQAGSGLEAFVTRNDGPKSGSLTDVNTNSATEPFLVGFIAPTGQPD